MNSRQQTRLIHIVLILLSICWILFFNKLIVIPIVLITMSIGNLIKIFRVKKVFIRDFDNSESLDNRDEILLPITFNEFSVREFENTVYFEKKIKNRIPTTLIKLDLSKKKIQIKNLKNIDLCTIDYFALMTVKTKKTKRHIVQLTCRTNNDLQELFSYVCPDYLNISEAKEFFEKTLKLIGTKTKTNIKLIDK